MAGASREAGRPLESAPNSRSRFSGSVPGVRDAIDVLRRQGFTALIVDLRHNPRELTRELIPVAETVLPAGTPLEQLVTRHGRAGRATRATPVVPLSMPLAVLRRRQYELDGRGARRRHPGGRTWRHRRQPDIRRCRRKTVVLVPRRRRPGRANLARPGRGGVALDGGGVIPDVVYPLVADELDHGIDSQLERAIQEVTARLERHDEGSRR
jgi:hypothetical protein